MNAPRTPVAPGLHVVLGSGPVGRAVAAELLRHDGTRVRIVSRSGRSVEGAEAVAADLSNFKATTDACKDAATVTFAAAPAYTRWTKDFPALQDAAIHAASKTGAVLVAVENLYGYGKTGTMRESDPFAATTRKGRVRAAMSERLMAVHQAGGVRATAVRASDLFGPTMGISALGERVWPQLMAGKPIGWIGDPDLPHTFTYLPDFACALVRAGAEPNAWGRTWHAPSPPDQTAREVLDHAAGLLGHPPPRIRLLPGSILRGMALVSPLMREVAEMAYQFEAPFFMDASAWSVTFKDTPTDWNDALQATLIAWGAPETVFRDAA